MTTKEELEARLGIKVTEATTGEFFAVPESLPGMPPIGSGPSPLEAKYNLLCGILREWST